MTRFILLAALLLTACGEGRKPQPDVCSEHQAAIDAWMKRTPTTPDEFQEEIGVLLADNKCGHITPAVLRKVFQDQAKFSRGSQ